MASVDRQTMEPKIMSAQETYEQYLAGLSQHIHALTKTMSLLLYLTGKLEDKEEVDLAPVLFLSIRQALLANSIISLANLYEDRDRSDGNLNKFLSFVEGNRKNITWEHGTVTQKDIDSQKGLILSKQSAVSHIKSQRDKYYAHLDKKYFFDASKLGEDYPVTVDDLEALINIALEINNIHNSAFNGVTYITMHEFEVMSLDKIFEVLRNSRNQELLADKQQS